MAAIHKLSQIAPLQEFDLFGVPGTQTTVERGITSEHRSISTLSSNSTIEFVIPTGFDEYVQLRECQFYLKFRVDIANVDKQAVSAETWNNVCICSCTHVIFTIFWYLF